MVASSPSSSICPPVLERRPVMTSHNSFCPLPSTPASPTISPSLSSREKSFSARMPLSFFALSRSSFRRTPPGAFVMAGKWKSTSLPTIIRVSSSLVTCSSTGLFPTILPERRTVTSSTMEMISSNLWVMRMMDFPSSRMSRSVLKNASVSWGVSTAVGSSRIKISTPM